MRVGQPIKRSIVVSIRDHVHNGVRGNLAILANGIKLFSNNQNGVWEEI